MTNYFDELKKIEEDIYRTMLNAKIDKFKAIPYIARWAAELKYKEETKDLLDSQRINKAIDDFIKGRVTIEDIEKLPPLNLRKKLALTEVSSTKDNSSSAILDLKKDLPQKRQKKDKNNIL